MNRSFQFNKRSQDFIGAHDETLSVSMRVSDPDRFAIWNPPLDPADAESGFDDLVNDANTSVNYFPLSSPDEFLTQRNLSANVVGLNDPPARVQCRRTLCS